MIATLIDTLQLAQLEVDSQEIADILWLTVHMGAPSHDYAEQFTRRLATEEKPKQDQEGDQTNFIIEDKEDPIIVNRSKPIRRGRRVVDVYLPATKIDKISSVGGLPFRSPGALALPDALNMGRSLRPLKRYIPSRTRSTLDEEATVRQSADSESLLPVMRPTPTRWLDLALVIDESSSMILWRQSVVEFRLLLERIGAFRSLETWYFSSQTHEDQLYLYPSLQAIAIRSDARRPRQLSDLNRRRLILVVSDCIGQAWYNNAVAEMIQEWEGTAIVALIHVLPRRLWSQTALGQAVAIHMRARTPGTINSGLEIELPSYWRLRKRSTENLALPVTTLEADSLASWVRLLTGTSGWWSPGVILPTTSLTEASLRRSERQSITSSDPQQLIKSFYTVASPTARELAGYLAAVPLLSIPLMRLVQQIMLKQSTQAHLAEVICSGLLKQTNPYQIMLHSDDIRYEFVDGVRNHLLDGVRIDDSVNILNHVFNALSTFINTQTGKPIEFLSILADPTLIDNVKLSESNLPFASVSINLLKRFGGNYARLALTLEKKFGMLRLDASFFKLLPPENDRNLWLYFIAPTIMAALLNPESTLVSAPTGYGKSTLAFIARQQMQARWLNINLEQLGIMDDDFMTVLLRQITQGMWQHIEANPMSLAKLQTRAAAARYFLERFSDVDVDYLLACLADDVPSYTEIIQTFGAIQPRELFNANATDTQRLSVLCDCIQKLGMQSVVLWIDLAQELKQIPSALLRVIESFFDSLHLMRRRILHIKCLAPPSVCQHLQSLRGMETLSVNRLTLQWSKEQLLHLIDQRLQQASDQQIHSLAQLIDPATFVAFLTEFSDPGSPPEWLILTRLIVEAADSINKVPISGSIWLAVRRAYCAERVKIRLDEQGNFWRGKQMLTELTPKKRAIYPVITYLYEHPGVHRTYSLTHLLNVDETTLNTIIRRARKEHLEPFPPTEANSVEGWIYLVTDLRGGGYALRHTVKSP